MGKNKKRYDAHDEIEKSFNSSINERYNSYSDADVNAQIGALKSIIEYVKHRKKAGKSLLEVQDEVLTYISSVVEMIDESDLTNFYKLRTYEYMNGMDFTPYLEEIINLKIDLRQYEKDNLDKISPNIENNIIILLCSMILDIGAEKYRIKNEELIDLCEKIQNNNLDMSDLKTLKKYVDMYFKTIMIGKSEKWEEMKKNPENIRKKLCKYLDTIFEVIDLKQVLEPKKSKETGMCVEGSQDKITVVDANELHSKSTSLKLDSVNHSMSYLQGTKKIKYNMPLMNPFLSNNEDNNFLIFISDTFEGFKDICTDEEFDKVCGNLYMLAIMSEKAKSADMRDMAKKKIQKWFNAIEYGDSSTHIKEKLSKRIAILIDFFSANGDIDLFCNLNNERLRKIKLENLTIEPSDFCKKFKSKNGDFFDLLFPDVEGSTAQYYRESYRSTPLAETSTEAVIAMSAFYVNRLAKFAPKYARLRYILDYKDAIARIYENPDLEYEDLGYSDYDIRLYMSLYDELQTRILQQYFRRIPKGTVLYEEKEIEEIEEILDEIKPIYTNLVQDENFDFERDILNIMLDAGLIDKIYKMKEFSAKSLIYSAMTDKSKNIINWGCVLEDEGNNGDLVLIGFDIKSLNMPIFVHMKKNDLIKFLKDYAMVE